MLKTPQLDINTLLEQIVVLKTLFTAFTYKCDFVEDKQVEFLTSYFLPLYYNLGLEFESSKSNFSKEIKDLKRSHKSELRIQKDLLSNEFVKVGTLETTIVGLEAKSTDLEQELALIQQALVDSENQTQHLRHEVEELKREAERLEKDLDSCFSETRELDSINQQDTSRHTKRILELKEDIKRQQDVIKIQEEELLNQSSFRENQQDTIADLLDTTTSLKHQLALVVRQPQSPESPRLNRTYSLSEIDRRTRMANDGQMVATLKELFSREERKLIPLFSGDVDDRNVMDWLREAEKIATSNEWSDEQKLRFFPDRLKGEAFDCSLESKTKVRRGTDDDPTLTYEIWKNELIERFHNKADIEHLKHQLSNLKQTPDQRTKAFIAKLDNLYAAVYGKNPPPLGAQASANERRWCEAALNVRDEQKRKIFLSGLLPKIKNELWPRLPENPTYAELCKQAHIAESIVVQKELSNEKSILAVSSETQSPSSYSLFSTDNTDAFEYIRKKLENLQVSESSPRTGQKQDSKTIAAVSEWKGQGSNSSARQSRSGTPYLSRSNSESKLSERDTRSPSRHYTPNRDSHSRDKSFDRNTSRDRSYRVDNNRSFHRPQSSERTFTRHNSNRYPTNNTDRSRNFRQAFQPRQGTYEPRRPFGPNNFTNSSSQFNKSVNTGRRQVRFQSPVRNNENRDFGNRNRDSNRPRGYLNEKRCYTCNELGHLAGSCPSNNRMDLAFRNN